MAVQFFLDALPQRRQGYTHHTQAVVEIAAESPFTDRLLQVLIGGRKHLDVHPDLLLASETPQGAVLACRNLPILAVFHVPGLWLLNEMKKTLELIVKV